MEYDIEHLNNLYNEKKDICDKGKLIHDEVKDIIHSLLTQYYKDPFAEILHPFGDKDIRQVARDAVNFAKDIKENHQSLTKTVSELIDEMFEVDFTYFLCEIANGVYSGCTFLPVDCFKFCDYALETYLMDCLIEKIQSEIDISTKDLLNYAYCLSQLKPQHKKLLTINFSKYKSQLETQGKLTGVALGLSIQGPNINIKKLNKYLSLIDKSPKRLDKLAKEINSLYKNDRYMQHICENFFEDYKYELNEMHSLAQ